MPPGIYLARIVVGTWQHMIAYDAWRHIFFLGGGRATSARQRACTAGRGWYVSEDEIADPCKFAAFMRGMLEGLQGHLDTVYRVDVRVKLAQDTSYE